MLRKLSQYFMQFVSGFKTCRTPPNISTVTNKTSQFAEKYDYSDEQSQCDDVAQDSDEISFSYEIHIVNIEILKLCIEILRLV